MNNKVESTIEERMAKVIEARKAADEAYAEIEFEFPEAWAKLQRIEQARGAAELAKQAIRQELIDNKDFTTRQVEGYNISVSRTVKLGVLDESRISSDYKRTEEVIDVKKAQEFMKVMGKLPQGFEDQSTYRFNWKEIKNA